MISSAALKCSTILAKIRVVFVTRGALLVVEDGGRDSTPTSPFAPNFSKTFLRTNVTNSQTFGGNSSNIDFVHILQLDKP